MLSGSMVNFFEVCELPHTSRLIAEPFCQAGRIGRRNPRLNRATGRAPSYQDRREPRRGNAGM